MNFDTIENLPESVYDHTHGDKRRNDNSYVGAYDCGCGELDPVIEQWTGYVGFRVGASVCRNCGRVIALQIQSSGDMTHEILTPEGWDDE